MREEDRDPGVKDAINETEATKAVEIAESVEPAGDDTSYMYLDTEGSEPSKEEASDDIEDISEEIKKKPKKKSSKGKKHEPEAEDKPQDTSVQQFRTGKKKKGVKVLIIVLIVLAIIGFIVYRAIAAAQSIKDALANDNTTTAEIQRMNISKAISTTGTIQSKDVRTITSRLSGVRIDEVNIKVGDMVQQGDVIVTFSREDINKKIGQLEEDITEAKQVKNLDSGDRTNTYVNSYDIQNYYIATAYDTLQQKGDALQRAKDDLAKVCNDKGDYKRLHEEAEQHKGEINDLIASDDLDKQALGQKYRDAITNYESKMQSFAEQELQKQRLVDDAQKAYDNAFVDFNKKNYDASFSNAKSDYTLNKGNVQANDNVKNLERQKEQNEDSLDDYIVTAPISGLVTSVNAQEGNGYQATTGALVTIQAVDIFEVTTQVDEYDINNVKVGQKVAIMTDATGDDELEGRVTFIAPTATSVQSGSSASAATSSASTFEVKIDITNKDERLRLGMSAKLNILVDTHDNVLAVPYDAIEQKDDGSKVIYVVDNSAPTQPDKEDKSILGIQVIGTDGLIKSGSNSGGPGGTGDDSSGGFSPADKANAKEIPVQIGLESDYYTEVISNEIHEGMTVLVNSKAGELEQDMSLMGL